MIAVKPRPARGQWIPARCPACNDMLGEVDGGRLRKVCPRCRPKVVVTFDARTGGYLVERVDGTALSVASLATSLAAA